jgi:hypothetical protein
MIQRGSDTSFNNLWSLLLYIQSLLHYIENAQENKKNTILSYNIAEASKIHILSSPACSCGAPQEDANHFLFVCTKYSEIRNELFLSISDLSDAG